jgi:hypothetical protein
VSLKGKKVMFEDLVNEHRAAAAAEEVCVYLVEFGFDFFLLAYFLVSIANFLIVIAGERAWED